MAIILLLIIIISQSHIALADSEKNFSKYMQIWNEKKDLASQYLEEAEKAFKSGDELSGCVAQQKAAEFGIDATNSLIKAMKANGSNNGIENIESGLRKWEELKDFC